jgi:hypothetical protein
MVLVARRALLAILMAVIMIVIMIMVVLLQAQSGQAGQVRGQRFLLATQANHILSPQQFVK